MFQTAKFNGSLQLWKQTSRLLSPTTTQVQTAIASLVSFILNEYMYTLKYTENVLVIVRQDYGFSNTYQLMNILVKYHETYS